MLRLLLFSLGPFVVHSIGGNVGPVHLARQYMKVKGQFVGVNSSTMAFVRNQTHVVRLGGKCLYPLSHSPSLECFCLVLNAGFGAGGHRSVWGPDYS